MFHIPTLLNYASALSALVAAALWYLSATAKVPPNNQPDKDGWIPASIEVDGSDFIASAVKQQQLSRKGAYAAAIAALCQGLSTGLLAMVAA